MTPAPAWSRDATVAAVRDVLAGPRGITGNALLHDATLTPDGLLVTFTWRKDPTLYGYLADDSDPTPSPWMGIPAGSPDAWAQDLRMKLMESLETGAVRWAPRRTQTEPVILDLDQTPRIRHRYYISEVPTAAIEPGVPVIVIGGGPVPVFDPARAGQWLGEAGMDVTPGRTALQAGRLLCWLQAYTDDARPTAAGHAAASWAGADTAVLHTLEATAEVDDAPALLTRLLWQVAYEATEHGAQRLDLTAAPAQVIRALDLPPEPHGTVMALPPSARIDPRYR